MRLQISIGWLAGNGRMSALSSYACKKLGHSPSLEPWPVHTGRVHLCTWALTPSESKHTLVRPCCMPGQVAQCDALLAQGIDTVPVYPQMWNIPEAGFFCHVCWAWNVYAAPISGYCQLTAFSARMRPSIILPKLSARNSSLEGVASGLNSCTQRLASKLMRSATTRLRRSL